VKKVWTTICERGLARQWPRCRPPRFICDLQASLLCCQLCQVALPGSGRGQVRGFAGMATIPRACLVCVWGNLKAGLLGKARSVMPGRRAGLAARCQSGSAMGCGVWTLKSCMLILLSCASCSSRLADAAWTCFSVCVRKAPSGLCDQGCRQFGTKESVFNESNEDQGGVKFSISLWSCRRDFGRLGSDVRTALNRSLAARRQAWARRSDTSGSWDWCRTSWMARAMPAPPNASRWHIRAGNRRPSGAGGRWGSAMPIKRAEVIGRT